VNISKRLIGKEVRIYWRDPAGRKMTSRKEDHSDVVKGRAALALWVERGMVEFIDEGVLHLRQSRGEDVFADDDGKEWTLIYSVVPEVLIEKIEVYGDPVETLE